MFRGIYFKGRVGLKGRVGRKREGKYHTLRELLESVYDFYIFYPDSISYLSLLCQCSECDRETQWATYLARTIQLCYLNSPYLDKKSDHDSFGKILSNKGSENKGTSFQPSVIQTTQLTRSFSPLLLPMHSSQLRSQCTGIQMYVCWKIFFSWH